MTTYLSLTTATPPLIFLFRVMMMVMGVGGQSRQWTCDHLFADLLAKCT